MEKPVIKRKVDKSDHQVGHKYRFVDVFRDEVAAKRLEVTNKGLDDGDILSGEDLEQMLNAYLDERGMWTLNINSSFYALGIPDRMFSKYTTTSEMRWPSISDAIYGTTRLAWLLMKLNGVKGKDIFKPLPPGTTVKYLAKETYVQSILASIREYGGGADGQ